MLNTLPFDITFVDAADQVKFFTRGKSASSSALRHHRPQGAILPSPVQR